MKKDAFLVNMARGGIVDTAALTAALENGEIGAISLLVACGLTPSRGEARRLIQQGGVLVADEKISDIDRKWSADAFKGDGIIIKKGKKVFHRAVLK